MKTLNCQGFTRVIRIHPVSTVDICDEYYQENSSSGDCEEIHIRADRSGGADEQIKRGHPESHAASTAKIVGDVITET